MQPIESYFRARVTPCRNDTVRLRDNIAYAIMSVHASPLEADRLFVNWKEAGRPSSYSDIEDIWRDMEYGAQFWHNKADWLSSLCEVPDSWIIENARNRVKLDELKGLGMVKGSFAAALNGANVACLDRHMIRDLRRRRFRELMDTGISLESADRRLAPKNWSQYRALENVLRMRHGRGERDLFVIQWRAWNQVLGVVQDHRVLWGEESEVPF